MTDPSPKAEKLGRLHTRQLFPTCWTSFGLMHQAFRPFVRPLDDATVVFPDRRGPAGTSAPRCRPPDYNP